MIISKESITLGLLVMLCISLFMEIAAGAAAGGGGVTVRMEERVEKLVALWLFDEGSGNIVHDGIPNINIISNGNNGIIQGARWTGGISRSALEFDGIDDKVEIIKTPSVDLTKNVILEASVKRKSNADGTIIAKDRAYYLGIKDNKVIGGVYTDDCPGLCLGTNTWTFVQGNILLEQNIWYKLNMEYDGGRMSIGVYEYNKSNMYGRLIKKEENSAPKFGEIPKLPAQVFMGWGEPGLDQYFAGIIEDASIRSIEKKFIRGDTNRDGEVDVSDAVKILLYMSKGLELKCRDAADVNDDGRIDISDPSYLLNYLFKGGPQPSAPFPGPGNDLTADNLDCVL